MTSSSSDLTLISVPRTILRSNMLYPYGRSFLREGVAIVSPYLTQGATEDVLRHEATHLLNPQAGELATRVAANGPIALNPPTSRITSLLAKSPKANATAKLNID